MRASVGDDDLICVRIDHQISIVSDHDYLALGLGRDEQRNQFIEHRFRVQVFLWLIDHQRTIVGIVERKV
jgi:hypothetical protein